MTMTTTLTTSDNSDDDDYGDNDVIVGIFVIVDDVVL